MFSLLQLCRHLSDTDRCFGCCYYLSVCWLRKASIIQNPVSISADSLESKVKKPRTSRCFICWYGPSRGRGGGAQPTVAFVWRTFLVGLISADACDHPHLAHLCWNIWAMKMNPLHQCVQDSALWIYFCFDLHMKESVVENSLWLLVKWDNEDVRCDGVSGCLAGISLFFWMSLHPSARGPDRMSPSSGPASLPASPYFSHFC